MVCDKNIYVGKLYPCFPPKTEACLQVCLEEPGVTPQTGGIFHQTIIYCTDECVKNWIKIKNPYSLIFHILLSLSLYNMISLQALCLLQCQCLRKSNTHQSFFCLVLINLNVSWGGPRYCAIRGEGSYSTLRHCHCSSVQFLSLLSKVWAEMK